MIEEYMSNSETQPEEEYSLRRYFVPLTPVKIIHFIVIIGIVVFANSLFNPFIFDDIPQIVQNAQVHQISSITSFFAQSFAFPGAHAGDLLHIYFKPILFSTYTFLYSLSGASVFPFHALQLIIHIFNAIFVYLLFKRFIKSNVSFLLSVIFLVHPLNSESVIYIANLQDVLFTFFGLLALLLIPKNNTVFSPIRLSILFLSLLFSILSKETGIVFFLFVWLFVFFFHNKSLLTIIGIELGAFIIALALRYNASFHATPIMSLSLIQHESLLARMLSDPKIIFYYVSHFFLPIHLATGQEWVVKEFTLIDFNLPLLIDTVLFIALIVIGVVVYRKQKKIFSVYLFFTLWFLVGMGMHLQIIPLDVTVADRWFYFPMIGLLGLLGVTFERYITFTKPQIMLFFIVTFLLASTTFVRTAQWQSPLSLYKHDIKYAGNSPVMASYYGALLVDQGDLVEAEKYLTESVTSNPSIGSNLVNLAVLYEHQGKYASAEAIYKQHISQNKSSNYAVLSYQSLTRLALIHENNPTKAKYFAQKGLSLYPSNTLLMQYLAVADYFLGEKKEAESLSKKLYDSSPNTQTQKIYTLIKEDQLTREKLLQ